MPRTIPTSERWKAADATFLRRLLCDFVLKGRWQKWNCNVHCFLLIDCVTKCWTWIRKMKTETWFFINDSNIWVKEICSHVPTHKKNKTKHTHQSTITCACRQFVAVLDQWELPFKLYSWFYFNDFFKMLIICLHIQIFKNWIFRDIFFLTEFQHLKAIHMYSKIECNKFHGSWNSNSRKFIVIHSDCTV